MVCLNGEVVKRKDAKVSALDRGFLYGYGLFETMRAYGGCVFRLDRHLARLYGSAVKLSLDSELAAHNLEGYIYRTLKANGLGDARIRLTVSAGPGGRGIMPPKSGMIIVLVSAEPLDIPPPEVYRDGICAAVVSVRRNSLSPLSGIKSTSFLDSLIAHSEALSLGANEAILLNERGLLAEGSTSNIFMVVSGRLLTPSVDCGIIPGITREAVLEVAPRVGIEVMEGEFTLDDLAQAEEVFLTASVREIVPVASIDGRSVGMGRRGPVTERLMAAYKALVERETGLYIL